MTNPLKRGSAPNRDHPDYERPGSFKPGHQKIGGRKRGTPNVLTADYKRAILEAAYQIGNDGNGRDGIVGYFAWVARYHPATFGIPLLISLLPLEFTGGLLEHRVRPSIGAGAPRRNPSRRVPDADEDQRLRTCQSDQSTPHARQWHRAWPSGDHDR